MFVYVKNCTFVYMTTDFSGDWPSFGDPWPPTAPPKVKMLELPLGFAELK